MGRPNLGQLGTELSPYPNLLPASVRWEWDDLSWDPEWAGDDEQRVQPSPMLPDMGDPSPLTGSLVFGSSIGTAALGLCPGSQGLPRTVWVPESPSPRQSTPRVWRLRQNLGLRSTHLISDFYYSADAGELSPTRFPEQASLSISCLPGCRENRDQRVHCQAPSPSPNLSWGSPRGKTQPLSFSLLSIKGSACRSCPVLLFCAPGLPCSSPG